MPPSVKKIESSILSRPIGVFDSGLGGLTVFSEIEKALPGENLIYFGDTARVPYGAKSPKIVERYTMEIVNFLEACGVKMIVIACNTSTAIAYKKVKRHIKIPVIGVIEPACDIASRLSATRRIGVIGTKITVQSGAYPERLKAIDPKIKAFQKDCPLFVPLVEEGMTGGEIVNLVAEKYLGEFDDKGIDTLILGCTHYPLISGVISEVSGPGVTIINSAEQTACAVKDTLEKLGMLNRSKKDGKRRFYLTDASVNFIRIGEKFLRQKMKNIKVVKVWDILLQ
ncbi:MAG: glutamate racemase [Candidatus Wallbacteria bacterium GWC2_49_35]|uniref:Glutamate racemase n=1 Tax=Candidatus Wallbacteria bacterium GWC2_49_35 TaxID=1817813 RepID=A0A1F7WKI7_9BACT|nr:MAG: glutamate racemase [Candidatus Wallbacteria bacterium GWC2_49_35]HBC74389.1 glutamate racemase [Candidatus Wallbacteria bacterium]